MTSELHGQNGTEFELNVGDRDVLNWLTWGFQPKWGIYAPLSQADCKTVAKILRNKARLFRVINDDPSHWLQKTYHLFIQKIEFQEEFRDEETLRWMETVADWFDQCGGLVDEENS